MLGSLGWEELLVILVILVLLFGASRVGELGGALGRGIREFRAEARAPVEKPPAPSEAAQSRATTVSDGGGGDAARGANEALRALETLRDNGVLSAAEFEEKRAALAGAPRE